MARRVSPHLARVLFSASRLTPRTDTLRLAARLRFDHLRVQCDDDSQALAETLGVSVRQVQRLRVAFGVARPAGGRGR